MKSFLAHWGITTLAVFAAATFVPGIDFAGPQSLLLAGLLLGFLNAFVRPVLLRASLPFVLLSLGFFGMVINAALLKLVSLVVAGFTVGGYFPPLWGAVVISLATWALRRFFRVQMVGSPMPGGLWTFPTTPPPDKNDEPDTEWQREIDDETGGPRPMKTVQGRVIETKIEPPK